jgi:hypothetical protein
VGVAVLLQELRHRIIKPVLVAPSGDVMERYVGRHLLFLTVLSESTSLLSNIVSDRYLPHCNIFVEYRRTLPL